jgi:hypothetical protein
MNEIVMVFAAAFVMALFIEYPCMNIKKIVFDNPRKGDLDTKSINSDINQNLEKILEKTE